MALSADIFTGQIIASLIVLTFVAVFLLREWISQNARPGVFEDEEPLPEDPLPVAPQQHEQIGPVPPLGPPARMVIVNPQQRRPLPPDPHVNPPDLRPREMHPRLDTLHPMETAELGRRNFIPPVIPDPSRLDLESHGDEINRRPRKKKYKKKKSDSEDDDGLRVRRKMEKDAEIRRRMFHRRIHLAKTTAIRRRMTTRRAASSSPSSSPLPEVTESTKAAKQKHRFTFTASPVDANRNPTTSSSDLSRESSVDLTSSWQSLPAHPSDGFSSPTQSRPSPEVQLPTKSIPFPLQPPQPTEPPPPYPSRPLLPTIPLPRSGSSSPFLYSPGRTSLDSPSHSTYRAPEELTASLESGPSDYFARDDSSHHRDVRDLSNEATRGPAISSLQTDGSDTESLSGLEKDDIQAVHDRYFGNTLNTRNAPGPPVSLELLSDSDSDITTEDDGRGIGDLDDDDGQPVLFVPGGAVIAPVRDGEHALPEGNIVRGDGPPLGQAVAAAANQAAAEAVAAGNVENEEGDANVEDDMEGAMEGVFFVLPFRRYLLSHSSYRDEGSNFWRFSKCATAVIKTYRFLFVFLGCLDDFRARYCHRPMYLDSVYCRENHCAFICKCGRICFMIISDTIFQLDPHRMLQVMHLPIRAMRLITDPIVDLVAYILLDFTLPWALSTVSVFFDVFMFVGLNSIGRLFPNASPSAAELSSKLVCHIYRILWHLDSLELQLNHTSEFITKPMDFIMPWSVSSNTTTSTVTAAKSLSWLDSVPDYLGPFEPYFVRLGSEVREAVTSAQATWIRLAVGSGPTNRAFAISLGYVVTSFTFCLYLNLMTVGNAKTAGSAVRNVVKQQLLVIKVCQCVFA